MSEADTENLFKTMFDQLNTQVSAKKVYGEPVESNGVTVIPVAKVSWGFGGGSGTKGNGDGRKGSGGGGGARAVPIGYIELKEGGAAFRPIHDPAHWAAYGVGAGLLTLGSFAVIRALIKRR